MRSNKNGKTIGIHCFATGLYYMQSKLIDKQGRKSITDEVKIRKLLHNIPDIIKKSIKLHLPDDITYNDIISKSEQFEATNRVANVEYM